MQFTIKAAIICVVAVEGVNVHLRGSLLGPANNPTQQEIQQPGETDTFSANTKDFQAACTVDRMQDLHEHFICGIPQLKRVKDAFKLVAEAKLPELSWRNSLSLLFNSKDKEEARFGKLMLKCMNKCDQDQAESALTGLKVYLDILQSQLEKEMDPYGHYGKDVKWKGHRAYVCDSLNWEPEQPAAQIQASQQETAQIQASQQENGTF
jgi:hypothetical protein